MFDPVIVTSNVWPLFAVFGEIDTNLWENTINGQRVVYWEKNKERDFEFNNKIKEQK